VVWNIDLGIEELRRGEERRGEKGRIFSLFVMRRIPLIHF